MTMTSQTVNSKSVNTVNNANKANQKSELTDKSSVGFESLFANAMGAGKGTMNQLETQLQKNLSEQEEQKKQQPNQPLSDLNGVASAVHAAVWAQRDYATSGMSEAGQSTTSVSATQTPISQQSPVNQTPQSQTVQTQSSDTSSEAATDTPEGVSANGAEKADNAPPTDVKAQIRPSTSAGNANSVGSQAPSVDGQDFTADLNITALKQADAGTDQATTVALKTVDGADKTALPRDPAGKSTEPSALTEVTDTSEAKAKLDTSDKAVNRTQTRDTLGTETRVQAKGEDAQSQRTTQQADTRHVQTQRGDVVAAAQQQAGSRAQSTRELQAGDRKLVTGGVGASNTNNNQPLAGMAPLTTTRTGLANEATIKTPVNQPGFARELGEKVNWAIGKNLSTVDIKLNPEQFGNMSMRLVQKGQQLHLTIRTTEESAGAMMTQAVHSLKESLAQSGLQLTQFQVQTPSSQQSTGGQFQFNQDQQAGQSAMGQNSGGNGRGQGNEGSAGTAQTEPNAENRPSRPSRPDSNLDLFA